jgi:hypothetical protein
MLNRGVLLALGAEISNMKISKFAERSRSDLLHGRVVAPIAIHAPLAYDLLGAIFSFQVE